MRHDRAIMALCPGAPHPTIHSVNRYGLWIGGAHESGQVITSGCSGLGFPRVFSHPWQFPAFSASREAMAALNANDS